MSESRKSHGKNSPPLPHLMEQFSGHVEDLKSRLSSDSLSRYLYRHPLGCLEDLKLYKLVRQVAMGADERDLVEQCQDSVDLCLKLREELNLDRILDEDYFPASFVDCIEKHSMLSIAGFDLNGNPVIYIDLSSFIPSDFSIMWASNKLDIPFCFSGTELYDSKVFNLCTLWYVRMMEWVHRHRFADPTTATHSVTVLVYAEGLSLKDLSGDLRSFLAGVALIGKHLYPDIAERILIVNVHWFVDVIWPLLRALVDKQSASKVIIWSSSKTEKRMSHHIDNDNLPISLGGLFQPITRF